MYMYMYMYMYINLCLYICTLISKYLSPSLSLSLSLSPTLSLSIFLLLSFYVSFSTLRILAFSDFFWNFTGQKQSYEETLSITYQPLSVFRVRPVTRCVETMPGHTDAVLHVSYSPDGKRLGASDLILILILICMSILILICMNRFRESIYSLSSHLNVLTCRNVIRFYILYSYILIHLLLIWFPSETASGGGDKAVRFWNVITSMPQHTCLGHTHHVLCTTWSPDGNSFVSADRLISFFFISFFLLFFTSSILSSSLLSFFFPSIYLLPFSLWYFSLLSPIYFFTFDFPFFSILFFIFTGYFWRFFLSPSVYFRSGEIRVWDPKTGIQKGQPMRGHKKWVRLIFCQCFRRWFLSHLSRISLHSKNIVEQLKEDIHFSVHIVLFAIARLPQSTHTNI